MDLSSQSVSMMTFTENQHSTTVLARLMEQRKSGQFCDVKLDVKGHIYLAHRCVLASCSSHFENVLRGSREAIQYVTINTTHFEIFESMIQYMYTGKIIMDEDNIADLLRMSHMYAVPKLKTHCMEYLERTLDPSNVFQIKETAKKWNLPILAKTAHSFILANISQVANQKEIPDFSEKKFKDFITDSGFPMPEDLRFHVICTWIAADLIPRYKLFEDLVKIMQWERLDIQSLYNLIQTEKLFAQSDWCMCKILQMLECRNVLLPVYRESLRYLQDKIKIQENVEALLEKHEEESRAMEKENEKAKDNESKPTTSSDEPQKLQKEAKLDCAISESKPPKKASTSRGSEDSVDLTSKSHHATSSENNDEPREELMEFSLGGSPSDASESTAPWDALLDNRVKTEETGESSDGDLAEVNQLSVVNSGEELSHADSELADASEGKKPVLDQVLVPHELGKRKRKSKPKKLSIASTIGETKKRGKMPATKTTKFQVLKEKLKRVSQMKRQILDDDDDEEMENAEYAEEGIGDSQDPSVKTPKKKRGRPRIEGTSPRRRRAPRNTIQCEHCEFECPTESEMSEHMEKEHQANIIHTCSFCGFTSAWSKEYQKHMKQHFDGPPFSCDFDGCDFAGDRIQQLLYHRMRHTNERPYRCIVCNYGFRTKNNLQTHMRSHTGEKPFHCEVCGRKFGTKGTLEQHSVTHSEARPYLCDTCGFSTKYQSHLIAHKRIHSGDVFRCQYSGCKYSTPKRSQLACHMRSHMSIRQYICAVCSRAFVEKSHLVRHERIHLDDKPFKCTICEYSSTRRDKLKEHTEKHHAEGSSPKTPYKPRKPRRPNKSDSHLFFNSMTSDEQARELNDQMEKVLQKKHGVPDLPELLPLSMASSQAAIAAHQQQPQAAAHKAEGGGGGSGQQQHSKGGHHHERPMAPTGGGAGNHHGHGGDMTPLSNESDFRNMMLPPPSAHNTSLPAPLQPPLPPSTSSSHADLLSHAMAQSNADYQSTVIPLTLDAQSQNLLVNNPLAAFTLDPRLLHSSASQHMGGGGGGVHGGGGGYGGGAPGSGHDHGTAGSGGLPGYHGPPPPASMANSGHASGHPHADLSHLGMQMFGNMSNV